MNFATLWQTINKLKTELTADKVSLLFACLIVVLIVVFLQCSKHSKPQENRPQIMIKPSNNDSLIQQKFHKIDSTINTNNTYINNLQGERLQSYIDSVFKQ